MSRPCIMEIFLKYILWNTYKELVFKSPWKWAEPPSTHCQQSNCRYPTNTNGRSRGATNDEFHNDPRNEAAPLSFLFLLRTRSIIDDESEWHQRQHEFCTIPVHFSLPLSALRVLWPSTSIKQIQSEENEREETVKDQRGASLPLHLLFHGPTQSIKWDVYEYESESAAHTFYKIEWRPNQSYAIRSHY